VVTIHSFQNLEEIMDRVFFGKPLCQGTAIEEINEVIQHHSALNSFGAHVVKGFSTPRMQTFGIEFRLISRFPDI
jgi:hypothetical protein